jgi:hypothetical protein
MFGTDRSENISEIILDGEVLDAERPACVALVPVTQTVQWSRKAAIAPADPTFLTQLIATAEHEPQTRSLRRGSVEDAQTAYGVHPRERRSVARRTRQII